MTYSFTTEPIDRNAGEGMINEVIKSAVQGKGGEIDEALVVSVGAAMRSVHALVPALGPDVVSYTVTINGVHRKGRTRGVVTVSVAAHEYAKTDQPDDE